MADSTLQLEGKKVKIDEPEPVEFARTPVEEKYHEAMMRDNVIVTRHAGLVEWLNSRGIEGSVIEHADVKNVHGKHVYGVLPLHLAAEAASITTVDMPGLRPEQRGQDLTPAEMDAAGALLRTYEVRVKITNPPHNYYSPGGRIR